MDTLHELKANYRTGSGPSTLQEKREQEQARKEAERIKAEQLDKESMTFSSLFEIYLKAERLGRAISKINLLLSCSLQAGFQLWPEAGSFSW